MTVEDVIRTHTEGFNRALTAHDLDALSAIYADDYMLVRPDGSVLGKEDVLRDLGAGGLRFTSIELANVSVRIYDQTALLTGDSRTVRARTVWRIPACSFTEWIRRLSRRRRSRARGASAFRSSLSRINEGRSETTGQRRDRNHGRHLRRPFTGQTHVGASDRGGGRRLGHWWYGLRA